MTVNAQLAARPTARGVPGRWPVTAVFLLNGLTLSTYIVRAPSFKSAHHFSDGRFGLTGLLFALAALAAMQFVGPLVGRVGARAVLRATLAVMPLLLAGLAVAPGPWWFAAGATVLGAVHGTTDAAMNASAVAVERRAGRPILNGCHAAWSVSAVVASLSTAALAHAGVSLAAHLVVAGALLLAGGLVLGPRLPDTGRAEPAGGADGSAEAPQPRAGWSRDLLLLGLTVTAVMICEGGALGWGGIFLHDARHATLSLAAAAVTAYTGGQTLGRLAGDRLSLRWGGTPLFRLGAAVAAAGFAVAVLVARLPVAVAGFALAGLGTSVLVPLTFSAAGKLPGAPAALLVSRLTTFTYTGILLGPALIGWAADLFGLAATMAALVPLLALVALAPRPR
ncbi:MFS transporter [Dactylosporangium sp. NPDC051485]|uniref:MFS transporter n=1 Tax=Dactylosporangium sp. NPDC051485 TaxID=3154846 RepID=UPI0034195875